MSNLGAVKLARRRWEVFSLRLAVLLAGVFLVMSVGSGVSDAVSTSKEELDAALRSKANVERGAELFRSCAACHGSDGGGMRNGLVPRIGGQLASVLQKELTDYRHDRRWDPRMEATAGKHYLADARAIADVTAYVSQLRPKEASGHGSGEHLVHGAETYAQACGNCHGGAAEGDAEHRVPALAGQHYEYLRRQIYDGVDGRRPNFSRGHIKLMAQLDHADIEAVCDYLSRLGSGEQRAHGESAFRK